MHEFEINKAYKRRDDIHQFYGGNRMSGISTSSKSPFIFIFTGKQGHKYGYKDGYVGDVFEYTGEGQLGDMTFTGANRSIRDHTSDGKTLLLFQSQGKGKKYIFMGEFICGGYEHRSLADKTGAMRQGIIFHLLPLHKLDRQQIEELEEGKKAAAPLSIQKLREEAYKAVIGVSTSTALEALRITYSRSAKVKNYVLERAGGKCECCGKPAPFIRKDGTPYLEPHHIRQLSDNGLDHPRWVAALTPNCHREVHYGQNGAKINSRLEKIIAEKEASEVFD